ncbi:hypothetical protein ROSEINA2194_01108 [Roseburia inulinivorans DSM 16841]|uniref:Uncharacterized protein n=1 Tax=Roseburia inulinivorans DSM 16841 TaxID=622312 RepID=C0FQV5_9FIRM|nr:hypothetical protein ROSEINA2194_01108 [Roseburia inulinivorans DSM 16841]
MLRWIIFISWCGQGIAFLLPVVDFGQKKSRKPFLISCLVVSLVGD